MNACLDHLNQGGAAFYQFAWPMLWQSSLLIILLSGLDFVLRRRLRASLRYALWLVVLVKLCLPPTLALPTSPVWWLHKTSLPAAPASARHFSVTYDQPALSEFPPPATSPPAQHPTLAVSAWLLLLSAGVSLTLFLWLLARWAQIARRVRRAALSTSLTRLARETQSQIGLHLPVQVRLTTDSMSPAVCGLFRPAILIPQSLAGNFTEEQLRAVLLHELIHLRRRDVWVNFAQALLQIVYWWHPLLWFANARLRRAREEAVDDAVVLALRNEADGYALTLLAVAKLALRRPLVSLGLVGIMESRHALRQRIERLLEHRSPRRTGLTLASLLGLLAFTAIAVPMGIPIHESAIAGQNPQALSPNQARRDDQVRSQLARRPYLPQFHFKVRFVKMPAGTHVLDNMLALTNADTDAGLIGVLDEKNFLTVLHEMRQQGLEVIAVPEATTLTGRQTQMRVTQTITVITNVTFVSSKSNPFTFFTGSLEFGPVSDLTARVLDDGATIDLRTTDRLTDFLGYDKPPDGSVGALDTPVPIILPKVSVQQASAHLKIWDNETVVLAKLSKHYQDYGQHYFIRGKRIQLGDPDYLETPDPAFINSSVPDFKPADDGTDLFVFITVTIVDAAGNRVHSSPGFLATHNTIPPQ